ncbi:MAG: AsmA-like C-terminal region-containing protein [Myxococcota bacterium]
MRRWMVGSVVGLGALLVLLGLVLPGILAGRIKEAVREQANASLKADVEIGDIAVSAFSQFPQLEVRIDDVAIRGREPYEGVDLMTFEALNLGVDLWSAVAGPAIEIQKVEWVSPKLDIRIEEDGSGNLDIFPEAETVEAEDDTAGAFALELQSLTVTGLDLDYADASLGFATQLRNFGTTLSGRVDQDVVTVAAFVDAEAWSLEEGGVLLLRNAALRADVDLDYGLETGAITLRDNLVNINELAVSFAGTVTPVGEDTDLDLTYASKQTSFKALLSMVPAAYIEGYEDVKADGTFTLAGTAKGRLPAEGDDLPGFSLDITVDDGQVQYPDLPSSIDDIALTMAVAHPQGPADATTIDISRFAFSVADAPMAGRLKLTHPVTDPNVVLVASGTLDFKKLGAAMPSEGLPPEGVVELDLAVEGRASDFEARNADEVRAIGTVNARNLMLVDTGYATPIRVSRMTLQFDPRVVDVPRLEMTWLGSDLSGTAQFDNFVPYMLGTAPLAGRIDTTSRTLDLRPFQGESTGEGKADEGSEGVVAVVPEDLDLKLGADYAEVLTSDFRMRDMKGQFSVADQSLVIDELTASMLGGRVRISGRYTAKTPESADIDFRIETIAFDLRQTVGEFETLSRIAPLLKGVNGAFDSDFAMTSRIDREGNPDLTALASKGAVRAQGLTFTPQALNAAAGKLNRPSLNSLELAQRSVEFVIEEGQLRFDPFDAIIGGLPARVSGGAGIVERTLDLAIGLDVPARSLAGSPLLKGLTGTGNTLGVDLDITGSYDAPKVGVKLADGASLGEAIADEALDRVGLGREERVAQATRRGDQLVAEAEARAASVRSNAKTQADNLRREGERTAKRLIREAGNNPIKKVAANKAADVTRKQANKAADRVESEANQRADRLVKEARDQRSKLIAEARSGGD